VLWVGIGIALYSLVRATPHTTVRATAVSFRHVYPPDPLPQAPIPAERLGPLPTAHALSSLPVVTRSNRQVIGSLASLASVLPPGALAQDPSGTWELYRPLQLSSATSLVLRGPLTLDLAPGAFVVASHGASISLIDVTVQAVDANGVLESSALPTRGYLEVRDGGSAVLVGDTFVDLGHDVDDAYGVTFDGALQPMISSCNFRYDYYGLYVAGLPGGTIIGNHIVDSVSFGIEVHTDGNLLIVNNSVVGSGTSGMEMADHASHNRVFGNAITASRQSGLVIDQSSDANVVAKNQITSGFDGISLLNSEGNLLTGNLVGPVTSFGLEITAGASSNVAANNVFTGAIVGAYIHLGAKDNHLVDTLFANNYENVRVRSDARGNSVSPNPSRSEL